MAKVLLISAYLAAFVGFIGLLLTFSSTAQDLIPLFCRLQVMGAKLADIVVVLGFLFLLVFLFGSLLGGVSLLLGIIIIGWTSVKVVITTELLLFGSPGITASALAAALMAIRRVRTLDLGEAFRDTRSF